MKTLNTFRSIKGITASALAWAGTAAAHDGHGMGAGLHWHATDTWGFAVVAALAAVAFWLSRGGK